MQSDRYLLTCYRYIELNPVRANITDGPADYRWSSYPCNALGQWDPLIDPHEDHLRLGTEPAERQDDHQSPAVELSGREDEDRPLAALLLAPNGIEINPIDIAPRGEIAHLEVFPTGGDIVQPLPLYQGLPEFALQSLLFADKFV